MTPPLISAYVPCFNNAATVGQAVVSLRDQTMPPADLFVVDDGSTDGSVDVLRRLDVPVIHHTRNQGRGAARHIAMQRARHELVVCCDATTILEPTFLESVLPWFEDARVAAVFGRITQRPARTVVERWRGRHLFRLGHTRGDAVHGATLATWGAVVRASAVWAVGGYDSRLRHTEDSDLGSRLIASGRDVIYDPTADVLSIAHNTLLQVLERHWRWHAGKETRVTWRGYTRNAWYALRAMAVSDMGSGDPLSVPISILSPHYAFWRSWWHQQRRPGGCVRLDCER